ncbi:uncharacterized protein LOC126836555 [Adelges cooleyi]|uniref:uncharacterized protein LOC126836555 n=1 Tax=Adelges cooleyi TaxID=133065 RepID=UPI0021808FD5|nr:uncharacterized protein LOC126836555 [Adelges cooleyi]XP_050426037.1 uncharacterized protein LOC126836555 [Adelges cooleyi]XP_050426038.1 uncharacterized protein LOC126836555 [Adelges cooleyi]
MYIEKKIIMKITGKLFFIVLSSYAVNIAVGHKPSQLVGQVHPRALKAFMETQDDMKELSTLFDLVWTHVKGGTVSKDFDEYCQLITISFMILFDKYFGDTDKWNAAKPLIIAKHNELMPNDEPNDDSILVRTRRGFGLQVVQEQEEFIYSEISSRPPHKILEGLRPPAVIQVLESHPNMKELLTLYKIYWKYAENKNPEYEKFCRYLKYAFDYAYDRYYSDLDNF